MSFKRGGSEALIGRIIKEDNEEKRRAGAEGKCEEQELASGGAPGEREGVRSGADGRCRQRWWGRRPSCQVCEIFVFSPFCCLYLPSKK